MENICTVNRFEYIAAAAICQHITMLLHYLISNSGLSKFLFEILYQILTWNLKSKNIFAKIHKGGT